MEESGNRIEKHDADCADGTRIDAEGFGSKTMATEYLKHSDLTDKLINTYYLLYNELGDGFLESVYQKAFALMLKEQGIGFREQAPIRVTFHGVEMGEFLADLLVDNLRTSGIESRARTRAST